MLLAARGGYVLLVALLLIGAMVWLGRPIQSRAGRTDRAGRARDDVARELAYGEAPLREALAQTGANPNGVWARRALVLATIAGFVLVVVTIVRS